MTMTTEITSTSNAHAVQLLENFKQVEVANNQVLVRLIEKNSGKKSKGVLIQKQEEGYILEWTNDDTILMWLEEQLQELQCEVVRAVMNKQSYITPSDHDLDACAQYLINKHWNEFCDGPTQKQCASIWDTYLSERFIVRVQEKNPGIAVGRLADACKRYKSMFIESQLGNILSEQACNGIIEVVKSSSLPDSVQEVIIMLMRTGDDIEL